MFVLILLKRHMLISSRSCRNSCSVLAFTNSDMEYMLKRYQTSVFTLARILLFSSLRCSREIAFTFRCTMCMKWLHPTCGTVSLKSFSCMLLFSMRNARLKKSHKLSLLNSRSTANKIALE